MAGFGGFCGLANGRLQLSQEEKAAAGKRHEGCSGGFGGFWRVLGGFAGSQTAGFNFHKMRRPRLANGKRAAAEGLVGFGGFWRVLRGGKRQA